MGRFLWAILLPWFRPHSVRFHMLWPELRWRAWSRLRLRYRPAGPGLTPNGSGPRSQLGRQPHPANSHVGCRYSANDGRTSGPRCSLDAPQRRYLERRCRGYDPRGMLRLAAPRSADHPALPNRAFPGRRPVTGAAKKLHTCGTAHFSNELDQQQIGCQKGEIPERQPP